MSNEKIINDFTEGSIPRHLTRFMLPFMASNALQVLYSLVDMVVVGRYVGSAGLAGVSQGGILTLFVTMFCLGFSNGGQILVAQLIGAGRKNELSKVIGTLFSVTALIGLVLNVLLLTFRDEFLNFLKVPAEARDMAEEYVIICGAGLIFTHLYNAIAAILRGMGDSRHPFIFITLSSVLNLVLDLLLTGAMGMGVQGAAIATVISQAGAFAASAIFLISHRTSFYFDFRISSFRIENKNALTILRLGLPLAIQACAINLSMMLCNSYINRLGVVASATFGVGIKIDDIANKISQGVQYAAAPIVGQNVGAKSTQRVKITVLWTWLMSSVVFFLFFLAYYFLGSQIFRIFTDDADVLALSPVFIRAIMISFPAMVIMRGTSALLQGSGNTVIIMWLAFFDSALRLVLSYLFGIVMDLGFFGFVLGFGGAAYGVAIPGMAYFFSGRWKNKSLLEK